MVMHSATEMNVIVGGSPQQRGIPQNNPNKEEMIQKIADVN